MIRIVRVVGPYTAPTDDVIYLGRTALERIGASNTQTYPLHFYSAKMSEVHSNYFWCDKEKPDAKFIMEHGKYVKPEYAFLQAIKEDGDEQPIFETLEYYFTFKKEFPEIVRKLNKEIKIVDDLTLEYYLDFWGISEHHD